jgi:hypothetical protein
MLMDYYESSPLSVSNIKEDDLIAPSMRISDWLVVLILLMIPLVNLIMLIIWSIDKSGNPNRRSFAQAVLLFMAALLVLSGFWLGRITCWIFQLMNFM